ncbi:MAG: hypothetical protein H6510_16655 [Acidobacteria bacterium]|nr:hypothetical protein [Acidobacteriota bacterium]MCB9399446.1 hypothetical protein [Acidobacteriota bacterium]
MEYLVVDFSNIQGVCLCIHVDIGLKAIKSFDFLCGGVDEFIGIPAQISSLTSSDLLFELNSLFNKLDLGYIESRGLSLNDVKSLQNIIDLCHLEEGIKVSVKKRNQSRNGWVYVDVENDISPFYSGFESFPRSGVLIWG